MYVLAQYEPHTESRAQMVRYLVEHVRELDESIETLRWMTSNDPSNQVRLLADTYPATCTFGGAGYDVATARLSGRAVSRR